MSNPLERMTIVVRFPLGISTRITARTTARSATRKVLSIINSSSAALLTIAYPTAIRCYYLISHQAHGRRSSRMTTAIIKAVAVRMRVVMKTTATVATKGIKSRLHSQLQLLRKSGENSNDLQATRNKHHPLSNRPPLVTLQASLTSLAHLLSKECL